MIPIGQYTEEERRFFEEQIQALYNEMYMMLLVRTSSEQTADELIQVICLKAWKSFHNLKDRNNFRAWIKKILDHTVKDYYRKLYRERDHLLFIDDPESYIQNNSVSHSYYFSSLVSMKELANNLIRKDDWEMIGRAFLQLKPSYQNLLRLYLVEELSYQEIAELTGMKEGTVRVGISRGLKELAKLYHKIEEG